MPKLFDKLVDVMTPKAQVLSPEEKKAAEEQKKKTEEEATREAEARKFMTPEDIARSQFREAQQKKMSEQIKLSPSQEKMLTKSDLEIKIKDNVDSGDDYVVTVQGTIESSQGKVPVKLVKTIHAATSVFNAAPAEFSGILNGTQLKSYQASEMFGFYFPVAQALEILNKEFKKGEVKREAKRQSVESLEDELMGR